MAYDVEMIKDFIEHLELSLRIDHFEMTAGPDALNPELVEQIARYGRERGILRLLSTFSLERDKPELTHEQMMKAVRKFGKQMADRRQEQLRHLEALKDLLQEAYAHAEGREVEIRVPGSSVLNGSFFTDN
jgi:hypothetical protein